MGIDGGAGTGKKCGICGGDGKRCLGRLGMWQKVVSMFLSNNRANRQVISLFGSISPVHWDEYVFSPCPQTPIPHVYPALPL